MRKCVGSSIGRARNTFSQFSETIRIVSHGMFENYIKGQLAVLKVQERALEKHYTVCFPTVETRFDLILVEPYGEMYKIQVKYADGTPSDSEGAVYIDFRKQTRNNGNTRIYTKNEIDAIIAFIPKTNQLVWLGPEVFDMRGSATLRYKPSKNNQKNGVRLIDDYIW